MKITLSFACLILFCTFSFAQTELKNFSGTWVLDKDKSDMGFDKGPIKLTWKVKPQFPDSKLIITQTSTDITVVENGAPVSSIFYLDGKDSVIAGNDDPDDKPKAKLKDKKLTLESSIPVNGIKIGSRTARMKRIEVWELKDGSKLLVQNIKWEAEVGAGPGPMVKTYIRQ